MPALHDWLYALFTITRMVITTSKYLCHTMLIKMLLAMATDRPLLLIKNEMSLNAGFVP